MKLPDPRPSKRALPPSRRAFGALALAVLVPLAACSGDGETSQLELQVPVSAAEVGTGAVEDLLVATGTLRAPESVVLSAETGGFLRVARGPSGRRLAEGDPVRAGQTIAEITGADVRLASRLDATRERYQTVEREAKTRRRLFEEGLISEEELRQADASLADARLEWERSRLTEARTRLTTPISGVLMELARDATGMPVADGQLVSTGFRAAQVAPISPLVADVDLVGPDLARVEAGMPARVRHHAFPEETFEGRVIRLAPRIDPVTRTFRAEVEVGNEEARLRPGMFVEVTLVAERREGVPVVPREAVAERGGERVVFVVDGQRVVQRPVRLGLGDDDVVEVRQGVSPGERVVVRGLEILTDGSRVRVAGS